MSVIKAGNGASTSAVAVCRGCEGPLFVDDYFCDLGTMPLANDLLSREQLLAPELRWPLRPLICQRCLLVQLPHVPTPDMVFTDAYPFFSGASHSWLLHCRQFADQMAKQLGLGTTSRVLEIGANDGTMLRPFRGKGIPAVGVEPCQGVAQHALMEGLPVIIDWWSADCAKRLRRTLGRPSSRSWAADLVIANNVLAHVPDLQDFLLGVREILAPNGTAVFEVPYIGKLISQGQFDQVYAEHHSYFSIRSIWQALSRAGLDVAGIEEVPTHGGSLRVYAKLNVENYALAKWLAFEDLRGLGRFETYSAFRALPPQIKRGCQQQLAKWLGRGAVIAGYGASAKAAVTLNYLGWGTEVVPLVADITPIKQGKYIPGARIPIEHPSALRELRPDVVINFAWNWAVEAEANIRREVPQAEIVYLNPAYATKQVPERAA